MPQPRLPLAPQGAVPLSVANGPFLILYDVNRVDPMAIEYLAQQLDRLGVEFAITPMSGPDAIRLFRLSEGEIL